MRKYIDPVYLVVNEQAWINRSYAEIFDSLNEILNRIEDVERETDTLNKIVKFKMSEELWSKIYSHNPCRNDPKISEFYVKLLQDKIFPNLFRRVDVCPNADLCNYIEARNQVWNFSNSLVPEDVLIDWSNLIGGCLSCSAQDSLCVISPVCHPTIIDDQSGLLLDRFRVTHEVDELFDIQDFLSASIFRDNYYAKAIKAAVQIHYHQKVICGLWRGGLQPQDYEFNDSFWQTIKRAKLIEKDRVYKERFINSITQVVYNLDMQNIRLHVYQGEKISVNDRKYPKHSVDVFQMGQGTRDNRCSRIFYCKIKNKIHFYEFNSDRHAGE